MDTLLRAEMCTPLLVWLEGDFAFAQNKRNNHERGKETAGKSRENARKNNYARTSNKAKKNSARKRFNNKSNVTELHLEFRGTTVQQAGKNDA